MEPHYQLTDQVFEQQFEACILEPKIFTHEAHLRLAWLHLKKYGEEKTLKNICHQIKQFAEYHGDKDKFNQTATIASIKAVNHFIKKSNSSDFKGFIVEFPRLKFHFKALLDCHYSFNIFKNKIAKTQYLEPDLLPFD